MSNSRRQNVVPSVDPRSAPSYILGVNPYRAPSEQQFGSLQQERRTTLEQVKSLENIIASGDIKVYEATQLKELVVL